MILTAYLDESGTHSDSPVTVMAGVLANARQWERFEKEFSKIKKRHGFDVLHTKEFKHRQGEFKRWTNPQRIAVMKELLVLTTAEKRFTEGVTVTLDNAEYEASYKKIGDDPRRLRTESKYGLFSQLFIVFRHRGSQARSPREAAAPTFRIGKRAS